MKNRTLAIVAALAAFTVLLCGCTQSIEDMLSAPKLTADQTAVLAAVNDGRESDVKLEYPQSGDYRTPIQFVDLDADGEDEAVLCYSDSAVSVYARLTVLDKTEGEWEVVGDIEGAGTDIYALSLFDYGDGNAYILIEWSATNKNEHEAVLYRLSQGMLTRVLTQSCIAQLACDLTGDGKLELCFVYPQSTSGPFAITFVKFDGERFVRSATIRLNSDMLDCIALTCGSTADGTAALFVDENIGSSRQTTEVFHYKESFVSADGGSGEIARLCVRPLDSYASRTLSGKQIYIPSTLLDGRLQNKWVFWYSVAGGQVQLEYVMYSNISLSYGLCIPAELADSVLVTQNAFESNRIMLSYAETAEGQDSSIAELKVLTSSDEAQIYENEGFISAGRTDRYRYYIKLYGTGDVQRYILNNFVVF